MFYAFKIIPIKQSVRAFQVIKRKSNQIPILNKNTPSMQKNFRFLLTNEKTKKIQKL